MHIVDDHRLNRQVTLLPRHGLALVHQCVEKLNILLLADHRLVQLLDLLAIHGNLLLIIKRIFKPLFLQNLCVHVIYQNFMFRLLWVVCQDILLELLVLILDYNNFIESPLFQLFAEL